MAQDDKKSFDSSYWNVIGFFCTWILPLLLVGGSALIIVSIVRNRSKAAYDPLDA